MADLADLISMASTSTPGVAQGAQPIGYRQGLIKSWNPLTAENVVTVAGVDLVNLPVLSQGYGPVLAEGMPVAVAGVGSQMVILGRIAVPPATTPFVQAFGNDAATVNPLTIPSSGYFTVCTTTIPVPAWANSAMIVLCSSGKATNNSGVAGKSVFWKVAVTGGGSALESGAQLAIADSVGLPAVFSEVRAVTPGGSVSGTFQLAGTGLGSSSGSWVQLNMSALFLAAGT